MTCRPLMVSVLLLAALICGCKEDSASTELGADLPSSDKPAATLSISGRAMVGIGSGAAVSIYPFVAGTVDRQNSIGTGVIDDLGYFTLAIPRRYSLEPAVLEITLVDGQMDCVVVSGCGPTSPFGAAAPLGADGIALQLMVPRLSDSLDYRISMLSHLGAAEALSDITDTSSASGSGLDNLELMYLISRANTRVASRFDIIADVTTLPFVSVFSAAEQADATSAISVATALDSALLAGCLHFAPEQTISAALDFCETQYVTTGIPGRSSTNELDVLHLLDAMSDVLKLWQSQSGVDYSVAASEIQAQRGIVLSEELDTYSKGHPSEYIGLPLLEKGKRLVRDIRQVAASIDLSKLVSLSDLSGFVSGDTAIALADFGIVLEKSELMTGARFDNSVEVLEQVWQNVVKILSAHYRGNAFEDSSLVFSHSVEGGVHRIVFDDDIDACPNEQVYCRVRVNLAVEVNIGSYLTTERVDFLDLEDIIVVVSGRLAQDDYEITFPATSRSFNIDRFHVRFDKLENEDVTYLELQQARGGFEVEIASVTPSGTENFKGYVVVEVDDTAAVIRKSDVLEQGPSDTNRRDIETKYQLFHVFGLGASASGKITMSSGSEFFAAMNLTQSANGYAAGLIEYRVDEVLECSGLESCELISSESEFAGETPADYLGLTGSVAYKAILGGIAEPVLIRFSGSRASPDKTTINSLKVTYPGHALSLSGQFNNSGGITAMDATNLDGMRMYINSDGGKRQGAVTGPGGESVGVIEDGGDWVKIRFTDGYFVSM